MAAKKKKKVVTNKGDAELLGLHEKTVVLDVDAPQTVEGILGEVPEIAVDDTVAEIEEAQELLETLIAEKKDALPRCGHINAHSNGVDGKPDGLTCTRYAKHPGNHSAMHIEKNLEKLDETKEYEVEWSNAVDLPAVVQPVSDQNVPGWVKEREPTKYVEVK